MKKEYIVPAGCEVLYNEWHFSPAVKVGNQVWLSGQVGVDKNLVPGVGMTEQAELLFANVKEVLEAAGATLEDIIEINTYHTDLRGESAEFSAVKDKYIPNNFPAWSAFEVTKLALDELLVEARIFAIIGCGQ
ncbi:RidA family protein [Pseudomonas typographi]|uniref:RidA family protein n=1 Tax=Pseudomonas typographi TaxID=2715964 RepID=UPI00168478A6|nr:RidA family protein [Pseudomonas typographi]MBD1588843.1 RidA family protein [Pseudomonas typographi]